MGFMELFGAIFAFKCVAFAGNEKGAGGRENQQEGFHQAFLIAADE